MMTISDQPPKLGSLVIKSKLANSIILIASTTLLAFAAYSFFPNMYGVYARVYINHLERDDDIIQPRRTRHIQHIRFPHSRSCTNRTVRERRSQHMIWLDFYKYKLHLVRFMGYEVCNGCKQKSKIP